MATKRILHRIRLDKIAAVGSPCQEHATVAIIKHRQDTAYAIAKATFGEALEGNMIAEAVNEAFFQSFDGLWERNDAFRVALTDELSEGGDGSVASDAYVASVKDLVDSAVAAARDAGATAANTAPIEEAMKSAFMAWHQAIEKKEHEMTLKIINKAALIAAVSAFDAATSPFAHVGIIKQAAKDLGLESELPGEGPLAVEKTAPTDRVSELETEIKVLKMAPAIRAHYDGLSGDAQTAFLAKSATDQQAEIDAIEKGDPIVYTCKDGTQIRKSDGAVVLSLAKRNDEQADEIAKLRGTVGVSSIEKRAAEEFPNVAKSQAVNLLKSAQTVGVDTVEGKEIMQTLKSLNDNRGMLFKRTGSTEGGDQPADLAKARTDFNAKVEEIRKSGSMSRTEAMSKARTDYPDLFAEAYPESAKANEEFEQD